MKESMMSAAYVIARDNYKAASNATFKTLDSQFSEFGFDALYNASTEAMKLHISSMVLAERICSKSIPYEKAAEILSNQFPDFPTSILETALGNAYSDSR